MPRPHHESDRSASRPEGGWGVPLFVLGLCGLAAVVGWWWVNPELASDTSTLNRVRLAWEQEDWDAVTRWAEVWRQSPEAAALERGDVQFMVAAAWLHRAERNASVDALGQARLWLDQAKSAGIRREFTADLPALEIWLRYLEGGPADTALRELEAVARSATDRRFVLRRLARLYRDVRPPELAKARSAIETLLAQPKVVDADALRLELADTLVALGETREARATLDRLQSSDPALTRHAGRLRARCLLSEGRRSDALAVWRSLLPTRTWPKEERLLFAESLAAEGDTTKALTELADLANSRDAHPAVLEASLRAGEIAQKTGQTAEARQWFVHAWQMLVTSMASTPDRRHEVWARLEQALQRWLDAGHFGPALSLAQSMEQAAPAAETAELVARIQCRRGEAELAALPLRLGRERAVPESARDAMLAAADAYLRVKERAAHPEARLAAQVQAAKCLVEGRAYIRASAVLDAVMPTLPPGPQRTEALVVLGEATQALGQTRAESLLREAVAQPGPWSARARYLLALALVDQRQWGEAEDILRRLATRGLSEAEPPEARLARFTLGYVLLWQDKFVLAAQAFESACKLHPEDPSALEARYWIAAALVRAARVGEQDQPRTPSGRTILDAQRRQRLEQALAAFQTLSQEFADRHAKSALDEFQAQTWRTIRREMGEVLYLLQRYDEALQIFDFILFDGPRPLEAALVLRQMVLCRLAKSDTTEARKLLLRLQQQLDQVAEGELGGTQFTRAEWQQWIEWANQESR